jgi:hypothetical protein
VFLVVLALALQLGATALLNDPGTSWHIRVGQEVWRAGAPHADTFSFTRHGEPWISQYWLCDAAMAAVYRAWSWNGLVAASAVLLAWIYRMLFRAVLRTGANVAWAAVLVMLAAGCGAPHWLARPHLVSLWLLLVTFDRCRAFHDRGGRAIWALPAVFVLWSNVHGGFLAGLVVVGCSLVAQLARRRDSAWRGGVGTLVGVLAASACATLVNPYGWNLHVHLLRLLFSAGVRDLIDEWQPPDLTSAESQPLVAMLLMGLVLVILAWRRLDIFAALHLAVWTYFALAAVRQVAMAAIVFAMVLGGLACGVGGALGERFGLKALPRWLADIGSRVDDCTVGERAAGWCIWSMAFSGMVAVATALGVVIPPLGFGVARLSASRFPNDAVERLNAESGAGPLFHELEWGGYILLESDPPCRVFIDDRFELYGRSATLEYLDAIAGGPAWAALAEQHHFEYVLLRPNRPLVRILRDSERWETLHEDDVAVLLRRITGRRNDGREHLMPK